MAPGVTHKTLMNPKNQRSGPSGTYFSNNHGGFSETMVLPAKAMVYIGLDICWVYHVDLSPKNSAAAQQKSWFSIITLTLGPWFSPQKRGFSRNNPVKPHNKQPLTGCVAIVSIGGQLRKHRPGSSRHRLYAALQMSSAEPPTAW